MVIWKERKGNDILYPMKMRPYFRHGVETPWGGDGLRKLFSKAIPDELTGESLEVSALPGMPSTVENGELTGWTLEAVYEKYRGALTGMTDDAAFPLLVKLLDAREMLSVQVHPGDEYAAARHGKLGKTEAWVILDAPPGAKLVLGLKEGADLRSAVQRGALEEALHWLPVSAGDVLYIPHGLVHALGGGIRVYEIQQSSDVTYRLWDWNRVGPDGRKRALHLEDALNVARPLPGSPLGGASLDVPGGRETLYICDGNFELWRLDAAGRMVLEAGRMRLLTALGRCVVGWDGGAIALGAGDTVVIPAVCDAWLEGNLTAILSTTCDCERAAQRLGDRIRQVVGFEGA
jgi:mannose-6-phosphate isomerase